MRSIVKSLVRNEKGQAMVMILFLILVGGLIVASLLSYVGTGLLNGRVYERRTAELYAADAGVEDAIWKIQSGRVALCAGNRTHSYEIADINGRMVDITIEYQDDGTYKITSLASTDAGGGVAALPSSTAVEAYLDVEYMDFSSLLDNAIVSNNSIIIDNGVHVTGDVASGGTVVDKSGDIDGTITENAELNWPSSEALWAYYLNDVKDGMHYYGDALLDLEGNSCPSGPMYRTIDKIREAVNWPDGLGPLKVNGTLDITSSNNQQVVTLRLNDTLYITGDTKIYGPNANEPYRLNIDLNGQTIFVESSTAGAKNALEIKDCTIVGSGCIIAIGDVYFAPKGDVGGEDEFVLVMSVAGTTKLQPSGIFYGCIAGDLFVDVQSGKNATIINNGLAEGEDLNFPMGVGGSDELPPVIGTDIVSWKVIPLAPDQSGG
jgi:hypothetical protein